MSNYHSHSHSHSLKNEERKPKEQKTPIQLTGFVAMAFSFLGDTNTTVSVVLSIVRWLLCAWVFMIMTSNFHMTKYHEKIQDSLFFFSGRPWMEIQHLVDPGKASAWNMKKRLKMGLALKIQTESEARVAGKKLFQNVAKPGSE